MDNGVDIVIGNELRHKRGVADVAFDQGNVRYVCNVGGVARIGQGVEHDDPVIGRHLAPVADEIRADKACAPGNDQIGHVPSLSLPS